MAITRKYKYQLSRNGPLLKLRFLNVKVPMEGHGTSRGHCSYWKSRMLRRDVPRTITGLWVFTGKLHALLHLPRQIKMFGPLRCTSCWRYEAKEVPCKKITHRNCNFKNVPLTIAKHIQQLSGLNAKIDRHSKIFGEFSPWAKICDSSSHLPFKLQDSNWADLVRSCGVEINNCSLFSIAKRFKVSGNFLPRHCFP